MNIVELIEKIGVDNVKVQFLDTAMLSVKKDRHGTAVTFGCDVPITANGVSEVGVIVWVDREHFKQVVGE